MFSKNSALFYTPLAAVNDDGLGLFKVVSCHWLQSVYNMAPKSRESPEPVFARFIVSFDHGQATPLFGKFAASSKTHIGGQSEVD